MTDAPFPNDPIADPIESLASDTTTPESRTFSETFERPDVRRCWYFGVGEAVAWFFGTLFVQLSTGLSVALAFTIVTVVSTGKLAMPDRNDSMAWLIGSSQLIFVLITVVAVSLRYWGRTFQELNLSRPDARHVIMVIGGTLPLAFCVSAWSIPIQMGWQYLVNVYPILKTLDGLNAMEEIKRIADSMPIPALIFILAVLPAIGEELIFRGAVGRVLISHTGVWAGVLLTSFLFGWCHIHPVHAIAVMPIGIVLHLIYLSTRSFWLPMLLHFSNNCWAVVTTKISVVDPFENQLQIALLDWVKMITAVVAVICLGVGLWQSRVRYFYEDGTEWHSLRFPLRVPHITGIVRKTSRMNPVCWGLAVVCVVVCHIAVAADMMKALN